MTRKHAPEYSVTLTGPELEEIADLIDCKVSTIIRDDREAQTVRLRLISAAKKIAALGPLRERRHLPGRFGGRAARVDGGGQ